MSAIEAKRRGLVSDRLGLGFQGFLSSNRGTAQFEHVGVVDQAVADGVGDSRIRERLVPSFAFNRRHFRPNDLLGVHRRT